MNIGDTVYLVGVRGFTLALMSGKIVRIHDDDSVAIDVPNGHNSPWTRKKGEFFELEKDALEHLEVRRARIRL